MAYLISIFLHSAILIVHYQVGLFDLATCSYFLEGNYVVIRFAVLDTPMTALTVVFNLLNIYQIFVKSRRIRNQHLNRTTPLNVGLKNILPDGQMESSQSTSVKMHRKEIKAIACISMIVLNMLTTEFFFLIMLSIAFKCICNFSILNVSQNILFLFPFINPIILFIFHDSFRAKVCRFLFL